MLPLLKVQLCEASGLVMSAQKWCLDKMKTGSIVRLQTLYLLNLRLAQHIQMIRT